MNGNSSSDKIRAALRKAQRRASPDETDESSRDKIRPALRKAQRRAPPDEIDGMCRAQLRAAAKGGKLKEYGVNGNSSSDKIRAAAAA